MGDGEKASDVEGDHDELREGGFTLCCTPLEKSLVMEYAFLLVMVGGARSPRSLTP